jgi:microcystin-dependent protein
MAFQQLEDSIRNILKRLGGLESAPGFTVPPGVIWEYAGTVAPSGWILLPPGATASRTEHAALFTLIGVTYGAGDGSSTFGLPPRAGRVAVGLDTTQTEFNTLGKTGGAKTHTHTLGSTGYAKVRFDDANDWVATKQTTASTWVADYRTVGGNVGTSGTSHPFGAELGGVTNSESSVQPYIVLNFIIKT